MHELTPLMSQYAEMKSQYKDAILLFQMGDFFECFGEDAHTISSILGIVLTKREKKTDAPPMAGFPIKALDDYLPKLVKAGKKVAIARQMELPSQSKGIVRRAVTDIITQGTIVSQEGLLSDATNYLLCLYREKGWTGFAFADVSTGELKIYQQALSPEDVKILVEKINPREIILSAKEEFESGVFPRSTVIQPLSEKEFSWEKAQETVTKHFSVVNLDPLGLSGQRQSTIALGVLLSYVLETKKTEPLHLNTIQQWNPQEYLIVDQSTARNLDLFENQRTHSLENTLFSSLNMTHTPLGYRKLYEWLVFPLLDKTKIDERLDCIDYFMTFEQRTEIIEILKHIPDIERITALIALHRIHPRQLIQLRQALSSVEKIIHLFENENLPKLLKSSINALSTETITKLSSYLAASLNLDFSQENSSIFAKGYSQELDTLVDLSENGHKRIKELFEKEKADSGMTNLKLGFNKVFGYYFETSHANSSQIPAHFIKKQTLVNNDRYITEEIKNLEVKVLSAREDLGHLEQQLFADFVTSLSEYIAELKKISLFVGLIDVVISGALTAERYHFCRPVFVDDTTEIVIKESKHPVVSQTIPDFIANDLTISSDKNFIILTGPNMGGKSTFVRQIALIQIIAQAGFYVPSRKAELHVIDHIFARIGASDDISTGRSTFMVELSEVAYILRYATSKSLIILDEVGRGTSTYEGIALAWAISEYIANTIKATTLFTTHFRELTILEKEYSPFINYRVAIREEKDSVYFLHLIERGISEKSYGIHVAELVNLPPSVIENAKTVLDSFEKHQEPVKHATRRVNKKIPADQISFIAPQADEMKAIKEQLASIDIENITPLGAFALLQKIIAQLPKE